jgi:hypothetical protein
VCEKQIYAKLKKHNDQRYAGGYSTSLASSRHICKKADGFAWLSHSLPWKTMKCRDHPDDDNVFHLFLHKQK